MNDLHKSVYHTQLACMWEVLSRKMGNVHPRARFRNTHYLHFLQSAAAIATVFNDLQPRSVGELILDSVRATQYSVKQNTNLGIILLLAPLVCAGSPDRINHVLQGLTVDDTRLVYQAIREAQPGGLGESSEQDVHDEPTVTLRKAMGIAAERDLIALQYQNGFSEVLELGVNTLENGFALFQSVEAAIIHSQMYWLANHPDSLIIRKCGQGSALEVQQLAAAMLNRGGLQTPEGLRDGRNLDAYLRSDGHRLNPGTTADLITASLFVALQTGKLSAYATFDWPVSDWL